VIRYFITYEIPDQGVVGRIDAHRPKPVEGMGDIEAIEADIAKSKGVVAAEVVVTGWRPFEGQQHVEHEL
jgi:hypothetical protein